MDDVLGATDLLDAKRQAHAENWYLLQST